MVIAKLFAVSFILAVVISSLMLLSRNRLKKSRSRVKQEVSTTQISLTDYSIYVMSYPEKIIYTALAAAFIFALAYVFYHSVIISALVMPLAFFYPKIQGAKIADRRKQELNQHFKEALYSLVSSISAGKSVEMAFKDVGRDLAVMYPDPETPIIREFAAIAGKVEMNETIESALTDLARRSHDEDIQNFTDVFIAGKRSGGSMADIIKNSSTIISDKLRIKEEINTLLAERKLEQRVLNIMPVALILLLSWSTGDYMDPVFGTALGRVVMTVAILLLVLAYLISRKLTDIEV